MSTEKNKNDKGRKKLEYLETVASKQLYSNNKRKRKRGFSSIKLFLRTTNVEDISAAEYDRIWVLLFRCFWTSGKQDMQEKTMKKISELILCIPNHNSKMMFIRAGFLSLRKKWDDVRGQREEKFLMFVGRLLKHCLIMLKKYKWDQEMVQAFSIELYYIIQNLPFGLVKNFTQIVVKDLAKVTKGKISTVTLAALLNGFLECIMNLKPSLAVVSDIQDHIFLALAEQLKLCIRKSLLEEHNDNGNEAYKENNKEKVGSIADEQLGSRFGENDKCTPFIEFDEQVFVNIFRNYRDKEGIEKKARDIANVLIMVYDSITAMRVCIRKAEKAAENPRESKDEGSNSIIHSRVKKQYLVQNIKTWSKSNDILSNNNEDSENEINKNHCVSGDVKIEDIADVQEMGTNRTAQENNGNSVLTDIPDNDQSIDESINVNIQTEDGTEQSNEDISEGNGEIAQHALKEGGDETVELEDISRSCVNEVKNENESSENENHNSERLKRNIDSQDDLNGFNRKKKSKMAKVAENSQPRRQSLRSYTAVMRELEKKRLNMPPVLNRDHPEWKIVPKEKIVKLMSMFDDVTCGDPSRKVKFYLGRNCYQDVDDYNMSIEQNPNIPYSPNRKPGKGLLKRKMPNSPPGMKLMEIELNLPDE